MKHYLNIENLREYDIELPGGIIREKNDMGFEIGDIISITEKYDGANASITWEDDNIHIFSHKKELDYNNTLNGFYNYGLKLDKNIFKENPDYIFFGEWNIKNAIYYNKIEVASHWLIFDIYNKKTTEWLYPDEVKELCNKYGLEYINELYVGEFKSWDHCREFSHINTYGDTQEGIVVRDISKMNKSKYFWILKLVNENFKETKIRNHIKKEVDPQKKLEKENSLNIMSTIVTRRRVEKCLII